MHACAARALCLDTPPNRSASTGEGGSLYRSALRFGFGFCCCLFVCFRTPFIFLLRALAPYGGGGIMLAAVERVGRVWGRGGLGVRQGSCVCERERECVRV